MPDKIVRPPSSNPVYLAILVPELINPGSAISKTMRTRRYRFLKLGELLAMPDKIVCPPSSNLAYPAIKLPEAKNPGRAISYARQNRTPT